jgi:sec-independent protein translocase protein TatB
MLPGIGFGELVLIGVVLLLVVGPKDIPKVAQKVGQAVGKARRLMADVQASSEVDEIKRAVYGEGPQPAWQQPAPVPTPPAAVSSPRTEPAPAVATDPEEPEDDGAPVARLAGPAAAVAAVEANPPAQTKPEATA